MPYTARSHDPQLTLSVGEGVENAAGQAELSWERWVAGRSSEWQGRGVCVVGNDRLVICGCANGDVTADPDQLFTYDLLNLQWLSHQAEGIGPGNAPQHVAVSINSTVFIFWYQTRVWSGQPSLPGKHLNCSILSTSPHMQWKIGNFSDPPNLTQGYTATTDGANKVVLFGGEDQYHQLSNRVFRLDIATGKYTEVDCSGSQPVPRTGHSATYIPEASIRGGNSGGMESYYLKYNIKTQTGILIWGGQAPDGSFLNDMFFLDMTAWAWRKIKQQGTTPCPRMAHNLVRTAREGACGYLVLYGGTAHTSDVSLDITSVFNLATCMWLNDIDERGDLPPPRYGAYAERCVDGEHIVVFGGMKESSSDKYFDLYGLKNAVTGGWEQCAELAVDDDEFVDMAPSHAQLLTLEKERERLLQDNLRLRTDGHAVGEKNLKRALSVERKRWDQERTENDQTLLDRQRYLQEQTNEVVREKDLLVEENSRLEALVAELRGREHAAERDLRQEEHDMKRRLEDDFERMKRTHEAELASERTALEEKAAMLAAEQTRLKELWEQQRREAADHRLELEEERQNMEARCDERLAREREDLTRARTSLEAQQEAADIEERRLRSEKATLAELQAQLEAQQQRAEAEHADLVGERRKTDAEAIRLHDNLERKGHETEVIHNALERRLSEQEALHSEQVRHLNERELAWERERAEAVQAREEAREKDMEILDMSAVQSMSLVQDGIPHSCSKLLARTYAEATRPYASDSLPLQALFKLLKCGQLMRGHITVDVVLDIVHAAHSSIHPSNPIMPTQLDCDVFITVVVDVVHRLYGSTANDVIDMTVVEHVIEGGLKKTWASAALPSGLREDPGLEEMCAFPVAEVLHTYRDVLMQLFKTYTSSTSTVVSPYEFMTLMQLQSCLQAMRVIPHLTSAEEVQHTLLPRVTEAIQELSPHELTEVICRVARHGFNDPAPLAEKVLRLLDSPELRDAAFPPEAEKPYTRVPLGVKEEAVGVHTPVKERELRSGGYRDEAKRGGGGGGAGRGTLVMSPAEARDLLQDKASLRDAMQRIYLYYACLNSSAAGCEGMAANKWERLVKDVGCLATHRHHAHSTPTKQWQQGASGLVSKSDVDQVFADASAESGAKQLLDFDGLMIAFRRLACKMFPALGDTPHDALHRLLLEHALIRALRAPEVLLHPSMYEGNVEDLLSKHKKGITMLHSAYTPSARPVEISSQQFVKLLMDFKVVPQHMSHTESCQVYLASRLDKVDAGLKPITLFLDCIVRTAHVAFSKQPHDTKLVTSEAKLGELLNRLFVTDIHTLKYTLDRLGLKVPQQRSGTPPARPQVCILLASFPLSIRIGMHEFHALSTSLLFSLLIIVPPQTVSHIPHQPKYPDVALDDEDGMDRTLRQIFAAYSTNGKMDGAKFLRLCIETKVAHRTEFNRNQVCGWRFCTVKYQSKTSTPPNKIGGANVCTGCRAVRDHLL